jgi:hypothetical protein
LRGEFTRVEMGHMVIASAVNGRNSSLGSGNKLEGDTLTISGAPANDTTTGEEVVYRIAFQRVANSN